MNKKFYVLHDMNEDTVDVWSLTQEQVDLMNFLIEYDLLYSDNITLKPCEGSDIIEV